MKSKFLVMALFVFIQNGLVNSQSITSRSFKVNGDGNTFYPVVFTETNWNDGATEFEITRASVHLDASWRGSMVAKFRVHTYQWGNAANFIDADIRNGANNLIPTFIADWVDATIENGSFAIVVWLRGQSTYYFRSTNSAMALPTVYLNGYQQINGIMRSPTTQVNPNINQNGMNFGGNVLTKGDQTICGTLNMQNNDCSLKFGFKQLANCTAPTITGSGDCSIWFLNSDGTSKGIVTGGMSVINYGQQGGITAGLSTWGLWFSNNGSTTVKISPDGNATFDGTVKAIELETNPDVWADDVFAPGYKQMSLAELERYIKTNLHLPDVPTEEEVKKNGLNMAKMDALLLRKVEELTLTVIEQNKQIEALNARITEMENK